LSFLFKFQIGREFFVAISKRTNEIGVQAVASAFPDFPVSLIKVKLAFILFLKLN
jgi:hypothetical protein